MVTLNGHVPSTKCPLPNMRKSQTKSNRPGRFWDGDQTTYTYHLRMILSYLSQTNSRNV